MDTTRQYLEPIEQRLAAIAANRSSGAMELAVQAAELMTVSPPEQILRVARALLEAQPCMGPLFRVANDALLALEADQAYLGVQADQQPNGDAWKAFEAACHERFRRVESGIGAVATFSWSSTVHAWLSAARVHHPLQVFVGESRPHCEGQHLAAQLAEDGHRVIFVTDALLPSRITSCDVVLIGADAVMQEAVVNKAGSYALACAARDSGKPCLVATTSLKLLPPGLETLGFSIREDPARDVWDDAPDGVGVRNPLFEKVPQRLIDGYLLDGSFASTETALEMIADIRISSLWRGAADQSW